jgi:hypothetical protein
MEESVPRDPNEIQFHVWPIKVMAKGVVALMVGSAVTLFIAVLAVGLLF